MARLNRIMVIGNVGNEPEMRFTPSGKPVTNFSLATTRTYTSKDGERTDETLWFNIVAWGKLAENCNEYIEKGGQVYADGRLQTNEWEGEDGQKRYKLEIVANTVLFLGKKSEKQASGELTELEDEELSPGEIPF